MLVQYNLNGLGRIFCLGSIYKHKPALCSCTFLSYLCSHTLCSLSSTLVEAHSSRGTFPAFLPHLWPSRQPSVMCEWRCFHHPQHRSVKWQAKGTVDSERVAILNTGTCMSNRNWQHICALPPTYSHLSMHVFPKAWHVIPCLAVFLSKHVEFKWLSCICVRFVGFWVTLSS